MPGAEVDHSGTTFDDALLQELLSALRDAGSGTPRIGDAWFQSTVFTGDASFDEVTFEGIITFRSARFQGNAGFTYAIFEYFAGFDHVEFRGEAWFGGAQFKRGVAGFSRALFGGLAAFNEATFAQAATFAGARFEGVAEFDNADFEDDALFAGATFSCDARFVGTTFTGAASLGPMACQRTLNLSRAEFGAATTIEASAARAECRRTRWQDVATLRMRYAALDLTDAVVTQPLAVISHAVPFSFSLGASATTPLSEAGLVGPEAVRVESLQGVDAMHLVLTDVDLTGCRFAGAFHLDQLRLEGDTLFEQPPTGWRMRSGVPSRLARRRTLAEEHHWRALVAGNPAPPRGWTPGPDHPHPDLTPGPHDVAPLYRALRKAFEDAKNEPDAADFYYGEMEMRRHDKRRPFGERALITGYWLLSGYGLRATRALGWLFAAMTATVLAMMLWGLPTHDPQPVMTGTQAAPGQPVRLTTDNPDPELHGSYGSRVTGERAEKAARVVVNSVVFRSSGQKLTTAGSYIEMGSRFSEPVLLALAALAVRGRIKR